MWEGVLHMAPAPSYEHQRIVDELIAFFLPLLKRSQRGILRAGINVFRESDRNEDYRIPDLTFIAAGNQKIIVDDGTRGGGHPTRRSRCDPPTTRATTSSRSSHSSAFARSS